ncbi:NUDIX domain-containing protein [Salarchaeum sp. JOR-1]|uniref:NUDIX domain-containing protein n=1 Tax=Salarchaeum sp. JOR-1 TaxID=2599399 RepID=UPI00119895A5|nr:NUDIX domain-containing protein [Salarchaeum sp. JOR-1]QDX40021.1 NUDIX domain-containing protein [Salarchaeum sp. JOR-1]
MDEVHVVTCVLRHRGRVLLLRRSDAVGSYTGRWGMVAGHAEGAPDEQAWVEIEEETGLRDACTLVRRGDPFSVDDTDRGTRWTVHPSLFDCERRQVTPNEETTDWEWVNPVEIRRRETVPDLWTSYRRVAPTVETVREDREHGSAWLSLRALEVLRDAAIDAARRDALVALACDLRDARDMVVVANRVNRAMATDDFDGFPDAIQAVIDDAAVADEDAAARAADRITGETVVTLSRSRTVQRALETGDPDRVVVAESRPELEGVQVAESLADDCDVTLTTDAAAPGLLADADRVLVGADAVQSDGGLVNKTGTYPLALAAARADVPLDAVCARDKVAPERAHPTEESEHALVYDGDADLDVAAPLFETVPRDLVDAIVTEGGALRGDAIKRVAERHRRLADWE